MLHKIKQVTPQPDFTLMLAFDSGEHRQFDAKPYLHKGVFTNLQHYEKFNKVQTCGGALE